MMAVLTSRDQRRAVNTEIDLWVAPLLRPLHADEAALCRSIMTVQERRAADRFHEMRRRDQALVGRALLRRALTYRLGSGPERWAFETGAHGRPGLVGGQTSRRIDFNVAHTEGFVVCAVAERADVGVDVESLSRAGQLREVESKFLAESEALDLAQLAPDARDERLVRLWTLKEAYSKALGSGLALSYTEVVFGISDEGQSARIVSESPSEWHFRIFTAAPGYALALAVQSSGDSPRIVRRDGLDLLFGALAE